jgi:hypothetical protein
VIGSSVRYRSTSGLPSHHRKPYGASSPRASSPASPSPPTRSPAPSSPPNTPSPSASSAPNAPSPTSTSPSRFPAARCNCLFYVVILSEAKDPCISPLRLSLPLPLLLGTPRLQPWVSSASANLGALAPEVCSFQRSTKINVQSPCARPTLRKLPSQQRLRSQYARRGESLLTSTGHG